MKVEEHVPQWKTSWSMLEGGQPKLGAKVWCVKEQWEKVVCCNYGVGWKPWQKQLIVFYLPFAIYDPQFNLCLDLKYKKYLK